MPLRVGQMGAAKLVAIAQVSLVRYAVQKQILAEQLVASAYGLDRIEHRAAHTLQQHVVLIIDQRMRIEDVLRVFVPRQHLAGGLDRSGAVHDGGIEVVVVLLGLRHDAVEILRAVGPLGGMREKHLVSLGEARLEAGGSLAQHGEFAAREERLDLVHLLRNLGLPIQVVPESRPKLWRARLQFFGRVVKYAERVGIQLARRLPVAGKARRGRGPIPRPPPVAHRLELRLHLLGCGAKVGQLVFQVILERGDAPEQVAAGEGGRDAAQIVVEVADLVRQRLLCLHRIGEDAPIEHDLNLARFKQPACFPQRAQFRHSAGQFVAHLHELRHLHRPHVLHATELLRALGAVVALDAQHVFRVVRRELKVVFRHLLVARQRLPHPRLFGLLRIGSGDELTRARVKQDTLIGQLEQTVMHLRPVAGVVGHGGHTAGLTGELAQLLRETRCDQIAHAHARHRIDGCLGRHDMQQHAVGVALRAVGRLHDICDLAQRAAQPGIGADRPRGGVGLAGDSGYFSERVGAIADHGIAAMVDHEGVPQRRGGDQPAQRLGPRQIAGARLRVAAWVIVGVVPIRGADVAQVRVDLAHRIRRNPHPIRHAAGDGDRRQHAAGFVVGEKPVNLARAVARPLEGGHHLLGRVELAAQQVEVAIADKLAREGPRVLGDYTRSRQPTGTHFPWQSLTSDSADDLCGSKHRSTATGSGGGGKLVSQVCIAAQSVRDGPLGGLLNSSD